MYAAYKVFNFAYALINVYDRPASQRNIPDSVALNDRAAFAYLSRLRGRSSIEGDDP
jgi:hypothetical protein